MSPTSSPAPPPSDPHQRPHDREPLAEAIGHYVDRRQAEEIGASEAQERPPTTRRQLLPFAAGAIAVFVLAMALAIVLG